jgi:hypothetical protein
MMRVSRHTFVWPQIGNALLNFRERTIMTRYRNQAPGPNREMLVNSVTAINGAAPHLKRSRAGHWYQVIRRAPWAAEDADA